MTSQSASHGRRVDAPSRLSVAGSGGRSRNTANQAQALRAVATSANAIQVAATPISASQGTSVPLAITPRPMPVNTRALVPARSAIDTRDNAAGAPTTTSIAPVTPQASRQKPYQYTPASSAQA